MTGTSPPLDVDSVCPARNAAARKVRDQILVAKKLDPASRLKRKGRLVDLQPRSTCSLSELSEERAVIAICGSCGKNRKIYPSAGCRAFP